MGVNDHYHRPKRKIVQKAMEALGENPKECISQRELDKYSELDNVKDVFLAIGLDPRKLAGKARNPEWSFAYVNLVIPTDEPIITREMADSMQGRFSTLDTINLNEI
jgi:hypothetical protein